MKRKNLPLLFFILLFPAAHLFNGCASITQLRDVRSLTEASLTKAETAESKADAAMQRASEAQADARDAMEKAREAKQMVMEVSRADEMLPEDLEKLLRDAREAVDRAKAMAAMETPFKKHFEKTAVYFDFDSSYFSKEAAGVLDEKAAWLKANPDVSVVIEATTDDSGPPDYNQWLAERRGNRVKSYLEEAGIDPRRVTVDAIGEVSGGLPAENRRVRFRIK